MKLSGFKELQSAVANLTEREKLQLIEHLARSLQDQPMPSVEQRREALNALRSELATLPAANPEDGLSNRDHDRLLYGGDL